MRTGLSILAEDVAELASGCTVEDLAGADAGWAADLSSFGPWGACARPLFTDTTRCWRAAESSSDVPGTLVVGSCSSSLDVAWRLAALDRLPAWSSVLAVSQRAGRGQLRRTWISPPGNVYAALALPEDWPAGRRFAPDLTPLLVGLMLAAGFASLGFETRVKWPNDILLDNKKICGILIEERGGRLMAGIGVNLSVPPAAALYRDPLAAAPGSLPAAPFGPLRLWRRLLDVGRARLDTTLRQLSPEALIAHAEEKLAWLGEKATVVGAHLRRGAKTFDKWEGRIVGLTVDGSLRIVAGGEERLLTSGRLLGPR